MRLQELDIALSSLDDWRRLKAEHPWTCDLEAVREIVEHAKRCGIVSPHLGTIGPEGRVAWSDPINEFRHGATSGSSDGVHGSYGRISNALDP